MIAYIRDDRTHRREATAGDSIDQNRHDEKRVVVPAENFHRGDSEESYCPYYAAEALPGHDADHLDERREQDELECGHQHPCRNQHLNTTLGIRGVVRQAAGSR